MSVKIILNQRIKKRKKRANQMEIKHKKTEYLNAEHFIEEEINNVTCCTYFVLEPANPILENILLIFREINFTKFS